MAGVNGLCAKTNPVAIVDGEIRVGIDSHP
jgi:hypothetical protein